MRDKHDPERMNPNNATMNLLLSFYRDEPEIVKMIENALDNDKPVRFHVLWGQSILGNLYIKGNQHKYVPNEDKNRQADEVAFLIKECAAPRDWGAPIYFFQRMIENCCRFPGRGWIGYQTSHYNLEIARDQGDED